MLSFASGSRISLSPCSFSAFDWGECIYTFESVSLSQFAIAVEHSSPVTTQRSCIIMFSLSTFNESKNGQSFLFLLYMSSGYYARSLVFLLNLVLFSENYEG